MPDQMGTQPDPNDPSIGESGMGGKLLGAAAIGAGALALRYPAVRQLAAKGLRGAQAVRMTSMLSGLAPLKSMLGNVGAPIIAAAERKSMAPIKQFFNKQTVKDWGDALAQNNITSGTIAGGSRWNPFGRFMGAGDTATQKALQRAGMTAEESAREVLQAPIPQKLADALDSPVGQMMVPFRRTPFNQFTEGMEAMKFKHPVVTGGSMAVGAAGGAASADDQYPVAPGLIAAASARYGLPSLIGAFIGRGLAGGKGGGGIVSSGLPVSEYGIESAITDPLRPFKPSESALARVFRRFGGK